MTAKHNIEDERLGGYVLLYVLQYLQQSSNSCPFNQQIRFLLPPQSSRMLKIFLGHNFRNHLIESMRGTMPSGCQQTVLPKEVQMIMNDSLVMSSMKTVSPTMCIEALAHCASFSFAPKVVIPPPERDHREGNLLTFPKSTIDYRPYRPQRFQTNPRAPIAFGDLKLFEWHPGRDLSGVIVGWDITYVGNTILHCRDPENQNVQWTIFCALPMPKHPTDLMGERLIVHDPYLRIEAQGCVGVRVDFAKDLSFTTRGGPKGMLRDVWDESRCENAKNKGDRFLRTCDFQSQTQAVECYTAYLRSDDALLTSTADALADMSRCEAELGRHEEAVWGAAWCLLLQPQHHRASAVYESSLKLADAKELLCPVKSGMPTLATAGVMDQGIPLTSAERARLASEGAAHMKCGRWAEALASYGAALSQMDMLGRLISNLSLALQKLSWWHPILCAAPLACFLAPALREKCLQRYHQALMQLNCNEEAAHVASFCVGKGIVVSCAPSATFIGPVETAQIAGKGCGLVATRDIEKGEEILREPALVFAFSPGDGLTLTSVTYGRTLLQPDAAVCFSNLKRFIDCHPFSTVLLHDLYQLCYYDGVPSERPANLTVNDLQFAWKRRPMAEPFPGLQPDVGRLLEHVLQNSFGVQRTPLEKKGTGLFVLSSFMNHQLPANAVREFFDTSIDEHPSILVRASRRISAGEEVCVEYFSLFALLKDGASKLEHWSLPPSEGLPPEFSEWADAIMRRGAEIRGADDLTTLLQHVAATRSDVPLYVVEGVWSVLLDLPNVLAIWQHDERLRGVLTQMTPMFSMTDTQVRRVSSKRGRTLS